jgi:drug/metabolite transporter (DMT)-like permease
LSLNPPPLRGIYLMILAMFLIACNDAIGKHLTQTYPIWQVLWVRSWVFFGFALLWVWQRGGLLRALRSRRFALQLTRSLLLVIEITLFIISFRLLPLADVTALAAATPLVVLALAVPLLGERVGWHRWTAVIVGFAGMLIIARPGASSFGWLTLLPLSGVLLWGIYQILLRLVSRTDTAETTLLYTAAMIFLTMTLIAPWYWQTPADTLTWFWLVLGGVLNCGGHFTLIKALEAADASSLQPFNYTMIVWATLLGWLIFGDFPDRWTISGTTLIIAGGLYALYRERRLRS